MHLSHLYEDQKQWTEQKVVWSEIVSENLLGSLSQTNLLL